MLRPATAQQRRYSVGGAIDRCVRVGAACPRFYWPGRPGIHDDITEKRISFGGDGPKCYVDSANKIPVTCEARKEAILRVRLKLVRDDDVLACQPDAHTDRWGKVRATC